VFQAPGCSSLLVVERGLFIVVGIHVGLATGKPWNSRRTLRISWDETGFSTNPQLWSAIEKAFDESEWFVLLASEEGALSEWVNKEISHRITTKSVNHILPVVTDGPGIGIRRSVISPLSPPPFRRPRTERPLTPNSSARRDSWP
jgi:MTH538 TIR-like domain (DUF1863)